MTSGLGTSGTGCRAATADVKSYTFEIVSKVYGARTVTAPVRFQEEISKHTWHLRHHLTRAVGREFTVVTNIRGEDGRWRGLQLHVLIWRLMGNPPVREIDHRDGQPLNNADDNLRDGTGHNTQNIRWRRDNTSGVKGVSRVQSGRWRACISVKGKAIHLGTFDDIESARIARNAAAIRLHGEFASLSEPAVGGQGEVA